MVTWRRRGGRIVLTEDVNESEDGRAGDGGYPRGRDVRAEVYGDGDWVGCGVVVTVGRPS